jgi:predicted acyltransferase
MNGPSDGDLPVDRARLLSLDVYRGITIAAMILVNNPGSWGAVYPPLRHAVWHGWTPTDLVFPFFLLIVGVAIPLALGRREEGGTSRRELFLKITRRTIIIFALGVFLNGFPYYANMATIRIPGVLQRIALCYFFAAALFLTTSVRTQAIVALASLLVYWLVMTTVPVPGFGAGDLSRQGNLAAWIDRALLPGHTYKPDYDPEGLLSTLPAVGTTLLGVLAGHWLRSRRTPLEKDAGLFVAGACGVVAGWAWGGWFPINKALWTGSFAVFTAGMGLQLLALCYWLIEIQGWRRWATPFVIFGRNSITVYVLSGLLAKIMSLVKVASVDGRATDLKTFVFDHAFASWASPMNASLLFAIAYVLFWLAVMSLLHWKKIYIRF